MSFADRHSSPRSIDGRIVVFHVRFHVVLRRYCWQNNQGNYSAHNQFTAGLSRFGPAGTPSRVSYHQGVAQNNHEPAFLLVGNPLMNDARLSQTADRAKTRQPGLLV